MTADLDPISLTRTLLAYDTVNPPGEERACAHHVGRLLEDTGFRVDYHEFAERRTSLVARLDGSGSKLPICFTGHLDVVPLGKATWQHGPFAGEIDGDRIYGRGSSDMKGAVAAMVLMARRVAHLKRRAAGLVLVLTAGEETCCEGAHHLADDTDALGSAGAIVVGEPTSNHPLIAHKGVARYAITTRGVAAHASMPEQGENAIHKAAEVVLALQRFEFDVAPHPILGAPTLNIGTIAGGININSVPDEATLGVDIRTIPGQDGNGIHRQLQAALGSEVEIVPLDIEHSIATDFDHEWVQEVCDVVTPALGRHPEPAGAVYFTDGSVLKSAYGDPPTVILGPGEPTQAHKTEEYCRVSKLEGAVETYTEIARRWCCA